MFLVVFVFVFFVFAQIIEALYGAFGMMPGGSDDLEFLIQNHPILLFSWLPFFAAIEELIFRLPLRIFIKRNVNFSTLFVVSVTLSVLFGLAHGGWIGVPAQGIMGLMFCVVFLKCGGFQKKYLKAFFSSTLVHFVYNFIGFSLFLKFGT